MKSEIIKLVAALTIVSMSVSCGKENSSGLILLMSDSETVDHNAQEVKLGYKVLLDNGSDISVTTDADWINVGSPGESEVALSVSQNDSRTESRVAEIVVGYGDMEPLTFTLTQDYLRPVIGLERLSETVDCQAQEYFVSCEILNPIDGEEFNAETNRNGLKSSLNRRREASGCKFRKMRQRRIGQRRLFSLTRALKHVRSHLSRKPSRNMNSSVESNGH